MACKFGQGVFSIDHLGYSKWNKKLLRKKKYLANQNYQWYLPSNEIKYKIYIRKKRNSINTEERLKITEVVPIWTIGHFNQVEILNYILGQNLYF